MYNFDKRESAKGKKEKKILRVKKFCCVLIPISTKTENRPSKDKHR